MFRVLLILVSVLGAGGAAALMLERGRTSSRAGHAVSTNVPDVARPDRRARREAAPAPRAPARDARPLAELPGVEFVPPKKWKDAHVAAASRAPGWVRLPLHPDEPPEPRLRREDPGFVGPGACAECHRDEHDGWFATAHRRTAQLPDRTSVLGRFAPGENELATGDPSVTFVMEARPEGMFQTARVQRRGETFVHRERIDIVTGSGNHGQTYLYWRGDSLYELPVTWFAGVDRWVNSPNYTDGTVDFARPIHPRCLECHATWFRHVVGSENRFAKDEFLLGVSCERCHGPGADHVAFHRANPDERDAAHVVNPMDLPRDRANEVCAQCHSGGGVPRRASFTFRPGQELEAYLSIDVTSHAARGSVHTANQLSRLILSRCYTESRDMTCADCHDPHRHEHAATPVFSRRCLRCHDVEDCPPAFARGEAAREDCITCHMPVVLDRKVELQARDGFEFPDMRDHFIRVLRGGEGR